MNVDENHPSQDDVNLETEIGNEEVTENEEQASSENEEALEEAPQNEEDNSDATEDNSEGKEPEPGEEQQPRKQSRTSKRFKQLNYEMKKAKAESATLKEQLKRYQELNDKAEDEYDEFDQRSVAKLVASETAVLTNQQNLEIADIKVKQLEQAEKAEKVQAFYEAEAELSAKVPDYNEAVSQVGFLAENDTVTQMILDSDKGAEVTYYLAKNPNEALAVAQMPPLEAARFIGRVEAKITPPTPKTTTAAPKPVPKVGGGSSVSEKSDNDLSYEDYRKRHGFD